MSLRLPDGIPQIQDPGIVPVRDPKQKDKELRDQFLTLLLAQLQNQDPLQPLTDIEMTQQMAQFSQLEQLFNLNNNFDSMGQVMTSLNTLQAATLIGKSVKATGDTIEVTQGLPETITYKLPSDVASLKMTITAESGEAVKGIEITETGGRKEGQHDLIWDGTNSQGESVPDGTYTVRFEAKRVDGSDVSVNQFMDGKVTSVNFENGTVVLRVGDKDLNLADIVEIRE